LIDLVQFSVLTQRTAGLDVSNLFTQTNNKKTAMMICVAGNYTTDPIKQTGLSSYLNSDNEILDSEIFSSPKTKFSRIISKESNPKTTFDRRKKLRF
jgi:hypothetical protein